ncbi:MAG: hypothetical protein ACFBSD_02970 [Paracoccaceae bacterium]
MTENIFRGGVRLEVRLTSEHTLVYHFATVQEAEEIFNFLREFYPDAEGVMEPALH